MTDRELCTLKRADPAASLEHTPRPDDVLAGILATERHPRPWWPPGPRPSRLRLSFAVVVVVIAVAASLAVLFAGSSGPVTAKLPLRLEKALASSESGVRADLDGAREIELPDGSDVWIVPGEDGGACIGIADGSKVCGPAAEVAAGRLQLFQVPQNAVRAAPTSSITVTILGYNPQANIAEATLLAPNDEVLGEAALTEGVYKITVKDTDFTRRPDRIRYTGPGSSETVGL